MHPTIHNRKIALDTAHDVGPEVIVQGAIQALKRKGGEELYIIFAGDQRKIANIVNTHDPRGKISHRMDVVHTTEKFDNGEVERSPKEALRAKPDASITMAANLLTESEGRTLKANALVSAGDTGATAWIARRSLKKIQGIITPVIAATIPGRHHPIVMADVGANPDPTASPENYLHRAIMCEVLYNLKFGIPEKRRGIGQLNIGEEPEKGSQYERAVYRYLMEHMPNFIGNVEPTDMFKSKVRRKKEGEEDNGEYESSAHVVVTDGKTGNVFIKTSKGTLGLVWDKMPKFLKELARGIQRLGLTPKSLNYSKHGGSPLLGLRHPVIIAHGTAPANSIEKAIWQAATFDNQTFVSRVRECLDPKEEAVA